MTGGARELVARRDRVIRRVEDAGGDELRDERHGAFVIAHRAQAFQRQCQRLARVVQIDSMSTCKFA
jgi:hypothetical protein